MDNLDSAWIGLAGALVGGLIGGLGSYFGSVNATKKNINSMIEIQKMTAQAQLHRQLEFSLFKMDNMRDQIIKYNEMDKFFFVEYLIYDNEWHKHLAILLDDISIEHQDAIVLWFDGLSRLISHSKMKDGLISGTEIIKFHGNYDEVIESLVDVLRYLVSLRQYD